MKKEIIPIASEQYFARKNRRHQWWCENWWKFITYPFFTIFGTIGTIAIFILLCECVVRVGVWSSGRSGSDSVLKPAMDRIENLENTSRSHVYWICPEPEGPKVKYYTNQFYNATNYMVITNSYWTFNHDTQ